MRSMIEPFAGGNRREEKTRPFVLGTATVLAGRWCLAIARTGGRRGKKKNGCTKKGYTKNGGTGGRL